jgi:hypothetical protein
VIAIFAALLRVYERTYVEAQATPPVVVATRPLTGEPTVETIEMPPGPELKRELP